MNFVKLISLTVLFFHSFSCNEQNTESNHTEHHQKLVAEPIESEKDSLIDLKKEERKEPSNYNFKYNLEQVSHKANMSSDLVEISGLSYNANNNTLLAVNDERGNIYSLDAEFGKQLKKIDFGSSGDYEGIEMANNMVYVIKSNGNITEVDANTGKEKDKYKLPFKSSNDIEGLGFYQDKNALVIACKGQAHLKNKSKLKKTKAFYTFDLESKELDEKPFFTIKDKDLEKYFDNNKPNDLSKKAKKKLENRLTSFSPSAIAQHPETGHFYILSSIGKLLFICDTEGEILHVEFLNDKMFPQPEGICFSPDANMYISNEGRSLVGTVLRFNYKND